MTGAKQETKTFVKKSPEELNQFKLENGSTCYVISGNGDFAQLEANDIDRCYILCMTNVIVPGATPNAPYQTIKTPGIFKYVKTILGVTVTKVLATEISDVVIGEGVTFNLPRMPMDYVNRLEKFFREIYTRHGTEAIVLLTFDRKKTDSSGWGVLVPKQKNTGGHCEYDQTTVMKDKPSHVLIVGSAHSHPGMKAYASGTDHKDQAHFDGIHLTYGWLASNRNQIEYHAEIQSGDKNYIISVDKVFDNNIPLPELDETIESWCGQVTKAVVATTAPSTNRSSGYNRNTGYGGGSEAFAWESYRPEDAKGVTPGQIKRPTIQLPEGAPDGIADMAIVAVIPSKGEVHRCPICTSMITDQEMTYRRCIACNSYLMTDKEKVGDVVSARRDKDVGSWEIDLELKPKRPIVVYDKSAKKNGPYIIAYDPAA